jgi:hypothetical protein
LSSEYTERTEGVRVLELNSVMERLEGDNIAGHLSGLLIGGSD